MCDQLLSSFCNITCLPHDRPSSMACRWTTVALGDVLLPSYTFTRGFVDFHIINRNGKWRIIAWALSTNLSVKESMYLWLTQTTRRIYIYCQGGMDNQVPIIWEHECFCSTLVILRQRPCEQDHFNRFSSCHFLTVYSTQLSYANSSMLNVNYYDKPRCIFCWNLQKICDCRIFRYSHQVIQ